MRRLVGPIAGVLVLLAANYSIYTRQSLLADGQVVLLELAPVDPRSLMQGDYMALRFAVANEAFGAWEMSHEPEAMDGSLVLSLDAQQVGRFIRFDTGGSLSASELRMRYRVRNGEPKFATNAFFFQEGTAELYSAARYGEFRVNSDGDAILTGLRDADFSPLGGGIQDMH